jgi:hypothetical protein
MYVRRIDRNRVCNYTISTVRFGDTIETAIQKERGPFIVVQRYETEEQARQYHQEWMKFCEKMPEVVLDHTGVQCSLVEAEV